jgi:hypothetical protein
VVISRKKKKKTNFYFTLSQKDEFFIWFSLYISCVWYLRSLFWSCSRLKPPFYDHSASENPHDLFIQIFRLVKWWGLRKTNFHIPACLLLQVGRLFSNPESSSRGQLTVKASLRKPERGLHTIKRWRAVLGSFSALGVPNSALCYLFGIFCFGITSALHHPTEAEQCADFFRSGLVVGWSFPGPFLVMVCSLINELKTAMLLREICSTYKWRFKIGFQYALPPLTVGRMLLQ